MSKQRAFVRYTKSGKIVPGSMILTKGGYPKGPAKWTEVTTDLCCVSPEYTVMLKFYSISDIDNPVDIYNVDSWNQLFGLGDYGPYGEIFKKVQVEINEEDVKIFLIGGSNIILQNNFFQNTNSNIVEVIDDGAIVEVGERCFRFTSLERISLQNCKIVNAYAFSNSNLIYLNIPNVKYLKNNALSNLQISGELKLPELVYAEFAAFSGSYYSSFILPKLKTIGDNSFSGCSNLTTLYIPSCVKLGSTNENNNVFAGINNNNINIIINPSLITDQDLFQLSIVNTVTINGVLSIPFTGFTGNLTIQFNNISNADLLVGDASNVNDWNTFFDTPSWSTPFTAVNVVGNSVTLIGGQNVPLLTAKFSYNDSIVSVSDTGCVPYIGQECFNQCYSLTTANFAKAVIAEDYAFYNSGPFFDQNVLSNISFPELITAGQYCFWDNRASSLNFPNLITLGRHGFGASRFTSSINLPKVENIDSLAISQFGESVGSPLTLNIPSCKKLGPTVGDDSVFYLMFGKNITITLPVALMTAYFGNPDGDITALQANNTVTIITV